MTTTAREDLIGSWRLRSFELHAPDGTISWPYGKEVRGYLFYTDDGFMSAAFEGLDRAKAGSDDLSDVTRDVHWDLFNAYTGPFEVKDDRVFHHVEVASMPHFNGTTQERVFKIVGNQLVLETVPLQIGGDAPTGLLIWERV